MISHAPHKRKSMRPPNKKALSPARLAKADKRNARLRENRAGTAAPSERGGEVGKEKEEEMPVSGGGSSSSAPEFETTEKICFDLLLDKINNWESKKLGLLAEEKARFYERTRGLWGCKIRMSSCWSGVMPRRQRKSKYLKRNIKMC
jgi:hypothetical protein